MSRDLYDRSAMAGGFPLFLLDIEWSGRTWRFAQFAAVLTSDDGDLQYTGGLEAFDFKESADFLEQDLEANMVSAAVSFDGVNLLQEWSSGRVLEGSRAEFSYVVFRDGAPVQGHGERIVLMRGRVQEPQFGDPDEVDGWVSLSVEAEPMDESRLLLSGRKRIDSRFYYRDVDTADGKPWPVIIGNPGRTVMPIPPAPAPQVPQTLNLYSTPAYCVQRYDFASSTFTVRMMVAGHPVTDTEVNIQDDAFQAVTKTISTAKDDGGNQYSYVELAVGDVIALPGYTSVLSNYGKSRSYWVSRWDGGMVNPFGDGSLELAGDVCRWALSRSGQRVDDGAWANISVLLNRYRLAGYVNDGSVGAWEWLSGNILPLLPITVRAGPRGLRPVLSELHALTHARPVLSCKIGDTEEFLQLGAVETMRSTGDLVNRFTLNYSKIGYSQDYAAHVRVTDTVEEAADIPSEYSVLSVSRYGVRDGAMSTDYVYDSRTAAMIALGRVRATALPVRSVEVSAPFHYGWLQIGDIMSVTVDRLFLEDHLMMVTAKAWEDGEWRLRLVFEDNPIQNERKK